MTRIELIQGLIDKHGYKSYLEIGVNTPAQPGYSHDSIKIECKHGVDPNVDTTFRWTSDEFFKQYEEYIKPKVGYDIIFIDGDHTYEQAYRDIKNSLEILNEGGTIVVHDCNPTEEVIQRVPRESDAWTGDVWKAIVRCRLEGIDITTVDTDWGCAIVRKGKRNPYKLLEENRKNLLNLIPVDQWKQSQL